jgi:ABC-type nitrate/sulfonate/bicarbonate transport system substrate-binding protein
MLVSRSRCRRAAPLVLVLALAACGASAQPAGSSQAASPKAPSASASAQLRDVHLAYATQTATSLPIFIARDAGIFTSHGINADITFSRDGATAIAALVGATCSSSRWAIPT